MHTRHKQVQLTMQLAANVANKWESVLAEMRKSVALALETCEMPLLTATRSDLESSNSKNVNVQFTEM